MDDFPLYKNFDFSALQRVTYTTNGVEYNKYKILPGFTLRSLITPVMSKICKFFFLRSVKQILYFG